MKNDLRTCPFCPQPPCNEQEWEIDKKNKKVRCLIHTQWMTFDEWNKNTRPPSERLEVLDEDSLTELLFNLASIPKDKIKPYPNDTVALSGSLCRSIAKTICSHFSPPRVTVSEEEIEKIILENCEVMDGLILWALVAARIIVQRLTPQPTPTETESSK